MPIKAAKSFLRVFPNYTYRDKVITALAIIGILLMNLKLFLFPYGLFGFGGTEIYTEGLVSEVGIQNLNPLFVDYNAVDREISALIFSGLMKYDPAKQVVVDDMAISAVSEDKTEYTFTLKEGLRWHDGEPLTADDVYFTFHDVVMHPSFSNDVLKTNFAGVEIEQLDARTVKFKLEEPNVFFLSNLTTGILPKHILQNVDPFEILREEFNKKPVGSGPYMITDFPEVLSDGRMTVTLERSPYYTYSGEDNADIKFMKFVIYPNIERLIEDSDTVNAIVKIHSKYLKNFEDQERFNLIPYTPPQYSALFLNMESGIFKNNKNARIALQKAIDKEIIASNADGKIRVDTPFLVLDNDEWHFQVNLDEAKGAAKEAGYTYEHLDDDQERTGVRYNEDGEALEIKFVVRKFDESTSQYLDTFPVAQALKAFWESVGFSVELQFLELADFNSALITRDYDVVMVGQSLGYNFDAYSYWHSAQATPVGQNFSNYKSFQVDSLIEAVRSTFDLDKRRTKIEEMAAKIRDDIPAIFLYRPIYYYALDGKVENISLEGVVFPSDRFANIGQWKFKE
jgi:peptide/nickel transport system substrate-binding protein